MCGFRNCLKSLSSSAKGALPAPQKRTGLLLKKKSRHNLPNIFFIWPKCSRLKNRKLDDMKRSIEKISFFFLSEYFLEMSF